MDEPIAAVFALVACMTFLAGIAVGKFLYDEDSINRWLDKRENRRVSK